MEASTPAMPYTTQLVLSLLPGTRQGEMLPSMDATNKTSMSRVRYASLFVEERYTQ